MFDTVREELQTKITPAVPTRAATPPANREPLVVQRPTPPIKRTETAGLVAPKTSPTLVEFQNKNAPLPDWRIQLQNAVKQRKGGPAVAASPAPQMPVAAAVAAAPIAVAEKEASIADPRVAAAMRRIEQSQKTFHKPEPKLRRPKAMQPFEIVTPSASSTISAAAAAPARVQLPPTPKPTIVPTPQVAEPQPVAEKRVTNKLPLINDVAPDVEQPTVEVRKPFAPVIARVEKLDGAAPKLDFPEATRIEIKADQRKQEIEAAEYEDDNIEDLAPISMRFGAGLFDMIISGFISMLVLSPLAFASSNWWTFAGLLTFLGTLAAVAFVYMTLCLGFFGKTMGMRLFSLELVDAVENEYPTLRQAAVNTFFFLLTLPVGGAGFLTVFFNEENRAVHDLLSGTIQVKEF